jgi:hypothetical protein
MPEKSLARIQELAKFVFSNVAVIGTLLTGLGLFTDLGAVLENSWKLPAPLEDVPVAVAALGLSLFCASLAIWPKMSGVDLWDLDAVEGWYRRQILRRGIWMILSLILFSTAILVATLTGAGSLEKPKDPALSASWTGLEKDSKVKVTATAENVPSDWTMITIVRGYRLKGKATTIFRDWTRPDAAGELSVSGEIGVGEAFKKIESSSRFHAEGDAPGKFRGSSSRVIKRS